MARGHLRSVPRVEKGGLYEFEFGVINRVLVVDDDETLLNLLRVVLGRAE